MAEPTADAPAPASDDLPASAPRILDAALELAERHGWDAVHLHDIARAAGIRLANIGRHLGVALLKRRKITCFRRFACRNASFERPILMKL